MPSVNKVILIGNLTRDPQTRQLPSETLVAEFGLAANRKLKGVDGAEREEVCFLDCSAFGRQAEVIAKYCRKGKSLYVEGRLRYDSWEDKAGHGKRSKLSVIVENFQFLGSREESGGEERGVPRGSWGAGSLPPRPTKGKPEQPFGEELAFKEGDIPF